MKIQVLKAYEKTKEKPTLENFKKAGNTAINYFKEKTQTSLSDIQISYIWGHCYRKYEDISKAIDECEELLILDKEVKELKEEK